jgi:response regulator RpfG family c-di-GMP phosphodiesterase
MKNSGMHATAFIIGSSDGSGAGLADLCLEMGLRSIVGFSEIKQAEQQVKRTPICFFLFDQTSSNTRIEEISKAIRFSRNRQVRFAPMICFTESPSQQLVGTCIQSGLDDIIAPPFSASRVMKRLELLFDHPTTFFETPDYFGPDRRNKLSETKPTHKNRGKGGDHRRIEITRSFDTGVNILHDHFYRNGVRQTSERTTNLSNAVRPAP